MGIDKNEFDEYRNVFCNVGVYIKLKTPDDFLKIVETLTRIGIAGRDKKLYQSCHILHKKRILENERVKHYYAILHFKELFLLDKKTSNISDDDIARRNTISNVLFDWGLLDLIEPKFSSEPVIPIYRLKILSYKEKFDWELISKYNIGNY